MNVLVLFGSNVGISSIFPPDSFAFFRASASADLNLGADDLPLNNFQFSSSKFLIESLFISALDIKSN